MRRRTLLASALAAPAFIAGAARPGRAAERPVLRIGYQKASVTLVLARARGSFDQAFKPLGYDVTWAEFTSGPPLLEALNAGAVNFGFTGEPPMIFAQSAGVPLVYVAATQPSPNAVAIVITPASKLTRVEELVGKKVAVAKGSSAHYLLVAALAHAKVPYGAVTKVFLQPADARAAFSAGAVDAWSIWDPFYAGAQAAGARVLTNGEGLMPNRAFYSARRDFAEAHPEVLKQATAVINGVEAWEKAHIAETAALISPKIGLPQSVLETWFKREKYGVEPMTPAIFADQQKIADAFFKLNLIPDAVTVANAAWRA